MNTHNFIKTFVVTLKKSLIKSFMLSFKVSLLLTSSICFGQAVQVSGSQLGDTLHLEFSGRQQWSYEVERKVEGKSTRFTLQVPALDEAGLAKLKDLVSAYGGSIQSKAGPDNSQVLDLTIAAPNVEHFDYLTDRPSRLVIDFFPSKSSAKLGEFNKPAESKSSSEGTARSAGTKAGSRAIANRKAASPRKPATTDVLVLAKNEGAEANVDLTASDSGGAESTGQAGVFDGADPQFTRFEIKDYEIRPEAIQASQENVYIEFPPLREKPDELPILMSKMPVYKIDPADSDENKQARLLLTLFTKKRFNVFLKTVEWFQEKYPQSEYLEMIQFMKGDVHLSQWYQDRNPEDLDKAVVQYQQAMRAFPKSALGERTQLVIAYALLERGNYLASIQEFQGFLKKFPSSSNSDLANLAIAEAYFNLNRSTEALDHYAKVIQNAKRPQEKIRAKFLKGDVYLRAKDLDGAIRTYRQVLKELPKESLDHPSAYFNLAESLFRQRSHREALNAHLDFVRKFPSHPASGYSLTRVGEMLEALGANSKRVLGAYLETTFRYGESQGAIVARLRLLSERMKDMKEKELEKGISEITQLADQSPLPKIQEFARIMISDGYARRKQFDKANDILIKYYQSQPTSADQAILSRRILRNISDQVRQQVGENRFVEALETHQKYSGSWLKGHVRHDLNYNLGKAFELAGVFDESENLYRETLNSMVAGARGQASNDAMVGQPPSADALRLRLAAVHWSRGQSQAAFTALKEIENPGKLSPEEQIERVSLAAKVYEKKGEPETAIRFISELIRVWKGTPAMVAPLFVDLAGLEARLGKHDEAIRSYQRVDDLMTDSKEVPKEVHARALEKMGDLWAIKKDFAKAQQVLEKLLDTYESEMPLASVRYRLGKLMFDAGEIKKAADTWKPLSEAKDAVWSRLAQEHLKSANWNDDYKKYLQRIPAMSREGGSQ